MRTEKIDVRLNPREKAEIERLAAEQDISVSELVREMIRDAIQKSHQHTRWLKRYYKNNLDDL